jgi:NADH dehydrogenase/NADH:ubiquinone oxidoreductase subunit G
LYTHVIALGTTLKDPSQEPWFSSLKKNFVVLGTHGGALANSAHVLIPVAVPAECTGTYVNVDGTDQVSQQAVRPASGIVPAHQAILKMIEALGLGSPWKNLTELRQKFGHLATNDKTETNSNANLLAGAVAP